MKDLYNAVRGLIFPQRPNFRNTGQNFAQGITQGSAEYPPSLRELLRKFERLNRGHRDVLRYPALHVASTEPYLEHSPRRADVIRNTLAESFNDLFQYITGMPELPESKDFAAVLDARDELGYIAALLKFGLRSLCEVEAFTAKTSFVIERLRLEQDGPQAVMHLRISVGRTQATRAIVLGQAHIDTLRGARQTLAAASDLFEAWFRDVSLWDEFNPQVASAPAVDTSASASATTAAPAQPEQAAIAAEPVPLSAEEAALLARLQHDMTGFLSAYTAGTRAFMEKHWDAFRVIVTEPGPN